MDIFALKCSVSSVTILLKMAQWFWRRQKLTLAMSHSDRFKMGCGSRHVLSQKFVNRVSVQNACVPRA